MVIFAPDSDTLTRQIVDQRRDLLGYYPDGSAVSAGRAELEEFANSARPVRWWYVSDAGSGAIQDRPGAALDRQTSGRSQARAAVSGLVTTDTGRDMEGMDAVRGNASRTQSATARRNQLSYTLVVVDAGRVANVTPVAWMDYVSLVALAQIDPNAQTAGYDTVLNLFSSAQPASTGFSAWDDAYLKAVYRSRRDSGGNRQISDVARRMDEDLR